MTASNSPKTSEAIQRARESYLLQQPNCRGKLVMRAVQAVEPATSAGIKQRSRTVVIATENPVKRYDANRYSVIQEVLLMSGVQFRTERKQLPIIDSHDSSTVKNIVGSVRNIRIDMGRLIGEVHWASDKAAQTIAQKFADGHLSDFSVTAAPVEVLEVLRGQTWRGVEGPADIITKWYPLDASIVVAGADPFSTGE